MDLLFYGSSLRDWAAAAASAAALYLVLVGARRVLASRLARFAERTTNHVDDLAVEVVRRTRTFFLGAVAVYAGATWLALPPAPERILKAAVILAAVLQAAIWGNGVIAHVVQRQTARTPEENAASATTMNALGVLARALLWAILALLALDNLGVDITALVAGLGVGGVAVALAVQNILGDLFASLSIVLDKPFVIGDFIVVDDFAGTVEHVGLKTTRIRSLSGEQLVFSNADLLKSRVRNFNRMQERRVVFGFGVAYETPPATVAAIPGMVREIVEAQADVRFDRAHFKGYGASSLDFEVVYYTLDPDYNRYMDTQQAINLELLRRCAAAGIEFAYPTRTLYVRAAAAGAAPATDAPTPGIVRAAPAP
ncbi:MAG TPA: mechanosensitive ion channel family protein [Longimicrobiales bacterium]|nr:mechanosensitive ion channel family protein [Longimicrobiales bacterium]